MKNFVIIRHSGIKSRAALISALRHNTRQMDVPNSDGSGRIRTSGNVADALLRFDSSFSRVTEKPKKADADVVLEYVVTASPEMINDPKFDRMGYFKAADKYLRNLLGDDNFIHAAVHLDETSAHTHYFFTPIKKTEERVERKNVIVGKDPATGKPVRGIVEIHRPAGARLCASDWTDMKASSRLQTEFAEQVGEKFGLQRGIKKSKAKHQKIKTFYGNLAEENRKLMAENARLSNQKKQIMTDTINLVKNVDLAFHQLEAAAARPTPEGAIERAKNAIKNVFSALSAKIPELADTIEAMLTPAVRQVDEAAQPKPSLRDFLTSAASAARGNNPHI